MAVIDLGTPPTGVGGDKVGEAFTKVKTVIDGLDGASGYVVVADGEGAVVESIPLDDLAPGTADIDISGNAAGLSATLAPSSGGTGLTTIPAHGVVVGAGTSAASTVSPPYAVPDRVLLTGASGSDPNFTTVFPRRTSSPLAACQSVKQYSGTNAQATLGNLRTSEITIITKGEAGLSVPTWNTNHDMNAFGDGVILPNGVIITCYARQAQEAFADGLGTYACKLSFNNGANWGPEQTLLTANDPTFNVISDVAIWHNRLTGRSFAWCSVQDNATGRVRGQLKYTDSPYPAAADWSSLVGVSPYPAHFDFEYWAAMSIVTLDDASMLMFGYGKNAADASNRRTSICMKSTDNGLTWTYFSTIANGPSLGRDLIEPYGVIRPDGTILVALRDQINSVNVFASSSDHGATWTAISDLNVGGAGKPVLCTLTNGAIVLMTRSANANRESCLFVCRDGDGTLSTSWGQEQDFDPRHGLYYYGGLFEVAPNVLGCTFAGGLPGAPTNNTDWCFTSFSDGYAFHPTGSTHARNIFADGLAVNGQSVVPDPVEIAHIGTSATGTQLAAAVNALIDQARDNGTGYQCPADLPNMCGMWEPWQTLSSVNDVTCSFASDVNGAKDSGGVVSATQVKGTWIISTGLFLNSTSGGSGYNPLIDYDMLKGDGTATLTLTAFNAASVIALRIVDGSNLLMVDADGTNIQIYKVVAGTPTNLSGSVSLPVSGGNSLVLKVVANGNLIQAYANVNGGGFPSTPNVSWTLAGGDATTFANTNTKWGVLQFGTSTNHFSSFVFNGTLVVGDKIDELLDVSGLASGSAGKLLQTTAANQMAIKTQQSTFKQRMFLYGSGALYYETPSFTAKAGTFTIFWAGMLPVAVGGDRKLCKLWDGSGTHTLNVGISSGERLYFGDASTPLLGPTLTYPYGPVIIRAEFNGSSSKLYMNGQLVAAGTLGAASGITLFRLGDANNNVQWFAGTGFANTIYTASQAREYERRVASKLAIKGWNPW